jgi:hypothetical protein
MQFKRRFSDQVQDQLPIQPFFTTESKLGPTGPGECRKLVLLLRAHTYTHFTCSGWSNWSIRLFEWSKAGPWTVQGLVQRTYQRLEKGDRIEPRIEQFTDTQSVCL